MSNGWYYSESGKQLGPITFEEFRQRILSGSLAPDAMVWTQGMLNWQPLSEVRQKIVGEAAPATFAPMPTPAAGTQPIAYYNPTGGIEQRVANTLKGFPAFTGPRDEWPLSELQLNDLARAEKARKSIRGLAQTMRALGALWALGAIIFLGLLIFAATSGPRAAGMAAAPAAMLMGVLAGFAALGFYTASASLRCQIWAPITVIVLMGVFVLINLISLLAATSSSNSAAAASVAMGGCIGSLIPLLVLIAAIRALMGIKTFLQCPVWAQEALVFSKL